MGWYTLGPDRLEYKYGDVRAWAALCPLGTTTLDPRIAIATYDAETDEEDNPDLGDLEFVGTLQQAIEAAGRPWHHFEFVGRGGDLLVVERSRLATESGMRRVLAEIGERVREHEESVRTVLSDALRTVSAPDDIVELTVSSGVGWDLAGADLPLLVDWMNAEFAPHRISLDQLREGTVDGLDYRPPPELAQLFKELNASGSPAHLGLLGLAWAVRSGEDLVLDQPDDDYSLVAWEL
jgi:hypothetical protein